MGMAACIGKSLRPNGSSPRRSFDQAWYPGEAIGTLVLLEQAGKTTVTQTVLYESQEARDGILKSGMEQGVAASYGRLARTAVTRFGKRSKQI